MYEGKNNIDFQVLSIYLIYNRHFEKKNPSPFFIICAHGIDCAVHNQYSTLMFGVICH
jgi:hypothetical protein